MAPAPARLTRSRGGRENSSPHTVKPLPRRQEEGGSSPTKTKILSSPRPAPTPGRPPPPPLAPRLPPNSGRTLRPHLHARTRPQRAGRLARQASEPPPADRGALPPALPQLLRRRRRRHRRRPRHAPAAARPHRPASAWPTAAGAAAAALLSPAGRGRRCLTAEPAGRRS